jgi:hypothetical protein
MTNTYATEITGKQMAFLTRLLDEAVRLLAARTEVTGAEWPEAVDAVRSMRRGMDQMTKREASAAIGQAMDNNEMLRQELAGLGVQEGPTLSEPEYVTEPGMYLVGTRVFKVLPSRSSDRLYAKELMDFHWEDKMPVANGEAGKQLRFAYAKGAMREIRAEHRMTPEAERGFGKILGYCIDCGKLLTDPRSVDYGKGPVCSDNYTR